MIKFLLASQNMPFTVALAVMFIIALLEGATTLLGAGIFSFLESLLPDLDIDADIEGPDLDTPGPFTRLLSWLRIGEVPAIMLLIIFLTAFGLIGLGIQSTANEVLGKLLPGVIASVPAVLLGLPVVRILGSILGKIIPKDETEAVSEKSFIGRIAVVTLGSARSGSPAEAKLKDRYGQTHYVMVEPDGADEEFENGAQVILISQAGAVFKAIRNISDALADD